MMLVQAAPKTQPGGVHGALLIVAYHADDGPSPIKKPPIAKALKLMTRNIIVVKIILLSFDLTFHKSMTIYKRQQF
jgi:hypothetical protein